MGVRGVFSWGLVALTRAFHTISVTIGRARSVFLSGKAEEPSGLLSPMTLDVYERHGIERYAQFAAAVAGILDAAIRARSDLRCYPAQHRAKDLPSLRRKLAKYEIAEGSDLGPAIKDLAGCRLIFYSNNDVKRFLRFGIVHDNFDIDWRRTRVHYPGADRAAPDNQFIGYNYVVQLKQDRSALPAYSRFAGLWCEVQVQTILNHAWSALAHDTIYKRPDLGNHGQAQMQQISARMTKIMQKYLLPAGFEFQKVLDDFERLVAGKSFFDSEILDRIVSVEDNNQRFELLEAFEKTVLPLYDDIAEVLPNIYHSLLRTAVVAREVAPTPIETGFGRFDGKSSIQVLDRIVRIINRLRFVDVEETFGVLAELFVGARDDEERTIIKKAAVELASHDRRIWLQYGPAAQVLLVKRIDALEEGHRRQLRSLIREIYRSILGPTVSGTMSNSDSVTFSTSPVAASDALRTVRRRSIEGLFDQYRAAEADVERRSIISALLQATQTPNMGDYSDALLVIILEDTARIAAFCVSEAYRQSNAERQAIERALLTLHRRNRGLHTAGEHAATIAAARDEIDTAIARYTDVVNGDPAFVAFKTLVGHDSVFSEEWKDEGWGWREKRAYRSARIREFVTSLCADNIESWWQTTLECAPFDSSPHFGEFLRLVGEEKPDVCEAWLGRAAATPLARFIPALLHGLNRSRPEVAARFATDAIIGGKTLPEVLHFLRYAERLDTSVAKLAATFAIRHEAIPAIESALHLAVERVADLGAAEARSIFLSMLAYLGGKRIFGWIMAVSEIWRTAGLINALTDDDLRGVLSLLVAAPEVDWHLEGMLIDISARAPEDVIDFFGRRFALSNEMRETLARDRYEPLPFKFHRLAPALASHLDAVLQQAAGWHVEEPALARFEGAAFVAKVYPDWSPAYEEALWRLFESGDVGRRFALEVLANYEGRPFIHPLAREMVAALREDDDLLAVVENVLEETGEMLGDFGVVEVYRSKVDALRPWQTDERHRVRSFAERLIRSFENRIAAEQRRAEEDLAMRRLDYDESPVLPFEKG